MGFLMLIFMVCATRTNIVYTLIFLALLIVFILLSAAYWTIAAGNTAVGNRCVKVNIKQIRRMRKTRSNSTFLKGAGAALFVASLLGFYLLIVQLFEAMGFPFHLPIGDLGMLWTRFQVK